MAIDWIALAVNIIVSTIFMSPVLWIAGILLVGRKKARFLDSILIVTLGILIGRFMGLVLSGFTGFVVQIVLWLAMVKHFFDCGWLRSFVVTIFAGIIFVVLSLALAFVGFALIFFV